MTEHLLHFIWQFGYYQKASLTTTNNQAVQVLFAGTYNTNSGPDFTGARIKIDNETLVGTVELHLKSSHWKQHGHQTDKAYANVVLHVVWEHDGFEMPGVPVLELKDRVAKTLLQRYESLMQSRQFIPCAGSINTVKPLVWVGWKERLLTERLKNKVNRIAQTLAATQNNWEEVLWQNIARYAGGTVNKDAFENIAQLAPHKLLVKYRHNPAQIEALLLGVGGLLQSTETANQYYCQLQQEWLYLQQKHGLVSTVFPLQFLRMRPPSFPTIRLAQLASFVVAEPQPFAKVLAAQTVQEILPVFKTAASDFWTTHYHFGTESKPAEKHWGSALVNSLIINAVVSVVFAYGVATGSERYKEKAAAWLNHLEAEHNNIVTGFKKLGMICNSAFDSQALIELKTVYCDARRCLHCAVGYSLLKTDQDQAPQSTDTSISG